MRFTCAPLAIFGLCGGLLGGCSTYEYSRVDPHTIATTPADKPLSGRSTLGMPVRIPGHSTCLIPFALETEKPWYADNDPFTKGRAASTPAPSESLTRGYFSSGGSSRWHNAIVRDMKTGEEWTLLDRRGVISGWHMLGKAERRDAPFVSQALVFLATIEDTNHDGFLNNLDASVAVVTKGDGREPRVATPADAQVWSVAFDQDTGLMYLYVVQDTNHDGKFTVDDAPIPYVLDPAENLPAKPIVSQEALRRVEAMLK